MYANFHLLTSTFILNNKGFYIFHILSFEDKTVS